MAQLKAGIVIPARMASQRFPGKPLVKIEGIELLAWVIRGCQKSRLPVVVACDHADIFQLAVREGAEAVMTDSQLPSGTDRVWAAVAQRDFDVILNIQGDEPLVDSSVIEALLKPFKLSSTTPMSTLARKFSNEKDIEDLNKVKVLINTEGKAIYFSRFPIPFSRVQKSVSGNCYNHLGFYGYRADFLKSFCSTQVSFLEQSESLEQLRALEMGHPISIEVIDYQGHGVDTPLDIDSIAPLLRKRV